jgi:lipopolysaccharide assembly protein A
MKPIAWLFKWILKAAIFFTLFAFALNNQSDVTVRFFFGQQWTAPMVLVVLGAFAGGLLVGVLGMVPRWWRQRRRTQEVTTTPAAAVPASKPADLTENGYNGANIHGI